MNISNDINKVRCFTELINTGTCSYEYTVRYVDVVNGSGF